jgi:hypothetical protein
MRGFRLNGWQRIGIVLSILWLFVAFFGERNMVYGPILTSYKHCLEMASDWSVCDKSNDSAKVEAGKAEPFIFAIVALVPILALWLFG